MIKFLFAVPTITEAKQSSRQGRSQGGGSSSHVIWPGVPWCSSATGSVNATAISTVENVLVEVMESDICSDVSEMPCNVVCCADISVWDIHSAL